MEASRALTVETAGVATPAPSELVAALRLYPDLDGSPCEEESPEDHQILEGNAIAIIDRLGAIRWFEFRDGIDCFSAEAAKARAREVRAKLAAAKIDLNREGQPFEFFLLGGKQVPIDPAFDTLGGGTLGLIVWQEIDSSSTSSLFASLKAERALPLRADALVALHRPRSLEEAERGRQRLAFDELLTLQLGLAQRRARWQKDAKAPPLAAPDRDVERWLAGLPFTLTDGQQRAIAEIRTDIGRTIPMSRLLEGDVGSGKTVVAALAARIAVTSGAQAALMAPTELLAEQHFRTLSSLFADGGPSVRLLTSSASAPDRREILAALADGSLDVVVGTHALVVEGVTFKKLGLAVVDEQHRFGVRQRTTLREKGTDPHLLLTTATPIPRTLTQTLYKDVDLSVLDQLPAGRQEIRTEVRPPEALEKVWPWVRQHVADGEQAFIVAPRIDKGDGEDDAPSAVATYEELRSGGLKGLRLALLHGRLPSKERDDVMRRFAAREIDVLVATTVVEVGIDIPNATMMVILGAERFGLAQLHQLRGRVGRGEKRSYAVLVSDDAAESERLAAMTERKDGKPLDGFDLANRDLEIRGAGEFLGDEQHGISELRIVDLSDVDPRLARETAEDADAILALDPTLERPEHAGLAAGVEALWRRYALA